LEGTGVVSGLVTNSGRISPGTNVGTLTLTGSVEFQPGSALAVEIGGNMAGTTYDLLTVSNLAALSGNLRLSLTNRFLPQASDTFTVVAAGVRMGEFANAPDGTRLSTVDGLASFVVTYTPTGVVLGQFESPDSDGDGQIDYAEHLAGTDAGDSSNVFRIISIREQSTSQVAVRFTSQPGQSYGVQFSDNLANWFEVTSPAFSSPEPGVLEWIDDGSLTGGTAPLLLPTPRQYRVVLY
jgi:uncharacterized protein with beta-barrel porin domain